MPYLDIVIDLFILEKIFISGARFHYTIVLFSGIVIGIVIKKAIDIDIYNYSYYDRTIGR